MKDQTREIPATVRTVVTDRTIQIVLLPEVGMADGGIPVDLPMEMVPIELRLPNTLLTITMQNTDIVAIRAPDSRT